MSTLTEQRQRLNFRMIKSANPLPRLFAMTDDARTDDPLALVERLSNGCGLIFRHYDAPNRAEIAARLVANCRKNGITCLISGDLQLAMTLGADGLHLPEYMVKRPLYGLHHFRKKGGLLTSAAHSRSAAVAASHIGVDGLFVSPVFATKSHLGQKGLGITRFARLIRNLKCPIFALGGQSHVTANQILSAGAFGMAGISLFEASTYHDDSRKIG